MIELGMSVVELSEEEVQNLELTLANNHHLISEAARQLDCTIKELIEQEELSGAVQEVVDTNRELAPLVIAQYIRTVVPLISSYHLTTSQQVKGLTVDDFRQEAYLAMYDAMLGYDGHTRFSTYVYSCVKNRLSKYRESEIRGGNIRAHVERLGKSVTSLLRKGLPLKLALAWSGGNLDWCRKSLVDEENEPEEVSADPAVYDDHDGPDPDEERLRRLRLEAIALAPLTPIERDVVNAYSRGERRLSSINPSTGRPYTRQGFSYTFRIAKEKIQKTYDALLRKAAA